MPAAAHPPLFWFDSFFAGEITSEVFFFLKKSDKI